MCADCSRPLKKNQEIAKCRPSLVALENKLVDARREVSYCMLRWETQTPGTPAEDITAYDLKEALKAEARACNAYLDALADLQIKKP